MWRKMRLRKVKNAKEILQACPIYIEDAKKNKGKWDSVFPKKQSIHLEIGTGKGDFIIALALSYPEINFIGMEKESSVLVRAVEKIKDQNIPNLRFICEDASTIEELFEKEEENLYLNFSDPWPKKKHAKRRLTSNNFLTSYDKIFKREACIKLKTDNIEFFAYSLESLSKHGYTLEKVSLNLEEEDLRNYKTEYEKKFIELGKKINYVEALKEKNA